MNENTLNFQAGSQMQIISMKEAEVSDISAIYEISSRFSGSTEAWTQAEIEEIISNRQGYYVLAAEWNGELIGYAIGRFAWGKLHLMDIVVKEDMRGRGIGKAMLKHLIEFAQSKSLLEVYLEVRADNTPAIKLYHSFSFKTRFILRGLYDGKDGLAMYLPLSEANGETDEII